MTKALARHEAREARVVPVILRPCRWTSSPLAKLQALPKDGTPVSEWPSRDAAFDGVAVAVELIAEELHDQRRKAAETVKRNEGDQPLTSANAAWDAVWRAFREETEKARRTRETSEAEHEELRLRQARFVKACRHATAERAIATPAAPSPGAGAAPPSPACGQGDTVAAEDQKPLPHAGEVGALAPGEGAAGTPKPTPSAGIDLAPSAPQPKRH
jgi:hypothetical protein